jgi:hypothetical protein
MDRKDFLKQLWKQLFKPVIILGLLYYCVRFLIAVLNENGTERLLTIIILSLTILFALAYLTGELLSKMREKIYAKLSDKVKFKLRIIGKICDYLSGLFLGAVLYKFWTTEAIPAAIFIIILLAERINYIVKEEKSKVTQ